MQQIFKNKHLAPGLSDRRHIANKNLVCHFVQVIDPAWAGFIQTLAHLAVTQVEPCSPQCFVSAFIWHMIGDESSSAGHESSCPIRCQMKTR